MSMRVAAVSLTRLASECINETRDSTSCLLHQSLPDAITSNAKRTRASWINVPGREVRVSTTTATNKRMDAQQEFERAVTNNSINGEVCIFCWTKITAGQRTEDVISHKREYS